MSVADFSWIEKLVALGLSKYEALAYLALLEKNDTAALDVAERAGIPKQRIYDVLDNLQTKGFCRARQGRPRSYIAYQPEQALAAALDYHKQQQAAELERQAQLIEKLIPSLNRVFSGGNGTELSPRALNNEDAYRDIGGL